MQSKSLYGQYIKERENFEIIEDEFGFASYIISGDECYLRDVYVVPEQRRSKKCFELADKVAAIAKYKGCTFMTGTVYPGANGSTESLKVLLKYGFKVSQTTSEKIIFIKEL